MTFEDLHPFNGSGGYIVPNERNQIWRDLVKRLPVHKAAGICSSGEVGFFSILPAVREELVLIDHSYDSLAVALVKYLILRERGPKETHKLFTSGNETSLANAVDSVKGELPPKVRDSRYTTLSYFHVSSVVREWNNTPTGLVKKAGEKLDKVSFLHGDLTDLVDRGPFGLLYLSNALEHWGRNDRAPVAEQVEKAVKPGGYVIACGSRTPARWERVKSFTAGFDRKNPQYITWTQTLYRVPRKKVKA